MWSEPPPIVKRTRASSGRAGTIPSAAARGLVEGVAVLPDPGGLQVGPDAER